MKITNKQNLPKAIERAVVNDPYDSKNSDISATRLLQPPRIRVLQQRHWDEIEEDVSDRIWSLLGQSVHHVIERASEGTEDITEQRMYVEKDEITNGWVLSGTFDYLSTEGQLIDFKTTSAYSAIDALTKGKKEWEAQLNILDWLIRNSNVKLPIKVKSLTIMAILRDWSKIKSLTSENYPKQQSVMIPIKRWSIEEQDLYIKERIALHQNAMLQDEPEICSPEERWHKADQYAVMKNGRKSALRLLPSMDQAKKYLIDNNLIEGKGCQIVLRKGEDTRCSHYCSVNKFCTHFNNVVF
tara:strand:- start:1621 stop:2514 length:894 start_codon:yes stop_codon:yes gene_type:complete